MASTYFL